MTRRALAAGLAALLAVAIPAAQAQQIPANQTSTLKIGDMAPDFTLQDQNGNTVRLSDFRGKQNVVLAFFVLAFTGGWTREMQNYRDSLGKFRESNAQVLGISVDSSPSLKVFAEQNGVTFPLLSDFKREVAAKYGVLNEERGFANRATFVIDKSGRIQSIELGRSAIEVTGALGSCQAIK